MIGWESCPQGMNSEAQWAMWGNAASRGGMFAILKEKQNVRTVRKRLWEDSKFVIIKRGESKHERPISILGREELVKNTEKK